MLKLQENNGGDLWDDRDKLQMGSNLNKYVCEEYKVRSEKNG